jgi:TP901 family phage tail tape measure protein
VTDLVAKFTLQLDNRLTSGARRALGDLRRDTDEVSNAARRSKGAWEQLDRAIRKTSTQSLQRAGNFAGDALRVATGNLISGGISRGMDLAVNAVERGVDAASDFETKLVDIRKVAKGSDDSAKGIERISKGIKQASKDLGVMPDQVAELAKQITPVFSGKDDIVGLTTDVSKIGKAWDITGEAAGKYFADTSRGMRYTAQQTKDLFGGINELSNELGIKAADIADAFTRSSGVIQASGLSGRTGAALNATLIAAGATSDIAATGVRTFISRLEAGTAATKQQQHAFKTLGLNHVEVGRNMAKGGAVAEQQILDVVKAIGGLSKEKQLPVVMQMFGSESLGSIGAAATAVENLEKSFGIVNKATANYTSVLAEYDRVSGTSAARMDKLKANVGVLAIEFGDKLLPVVNRWVDYLNSPEGQKWGADAVEKAAKLVTDLAGAVEDVVGFLGYLNDNLGTTTLLVGGMGFAIAALTGPIGLAAAAGFAMGGLIAEGLDRVINRARRAQRALEELHQKAEDIRRKEREDELEKMHEEMETVQAEQNREKQASDAANRWYEQAKQKAGGKDEGMKLWKRRNSMREELLTGRFSSGTTFEERLASFEANLEPQDGNRRRADAMRRNVSPRLNPDGTVAGPGQRAGKGTIDINLYDKRVEAAMRDDDNLPVTVSLPRGSLR